MTGFAEHALDWLAWDREMADATPAWRITRDVMAWWDQFRGPERSSSGTYPPQDSEADPR